MPVHFSVYNGVHITVLYIQRSAKIMPIKYGDGLTSPLILSLVVTWISVFSNLLLLLICTEWYSPSSPKT